MLHWAASSSFHTTILNYLDRILFRDNSSCINLKCNHLLLEESISLYLMVGHQIHPLAVELPWCLAIHQAHIPSRDRIRMAFHWRRRIDSIWMLPTIRRAVHHTIINGQHREIHCRACRCRWEHDMPQSTLRYGKLSIVRERINRGNRLVVLVNSMYRIPTPYL